MVDERRSTFPVGVNETKSRFILDVSICTTTNVWNFTGHILCCSTLDTDNATKLVIQKKSHLKKSNWKS